LLPLALSNQSNLQQLDLSNNYFEGNLSVLTNLRSVTSLFLGNNRFNGTIPFFLSKIKQLNLSCNSLTGRFDAPSNGSFISIFWMDLSNNFLSGAVPGFQQSIYLQALILSSNKFAMNICDVLRSLVSTSLVYIAIANNSFFGQLPVGDDFLLGARKGILAIDFSYNSISGT
jgi:LRR receptor-like serine/threonine-protein kinase FLS2